MVLYNLNPAVALLFFFCLLLYILYLYISDGYYKIVHLLPVTRHLPHLALAMDESMNEWIDWLIGYRWPLAAFFLSHALYLSFHFV